MMYRVAVFISAWALACLFGFGSIPVANAEWGIYNSLREMFKQQPTKPRVIKPKRTRTRRLGIGLPKLSFAYAHQAGRHKRYRYSHQTPYGYYRHPYRHGFASADLAEHERNTPTAVRSGQRKKLGLRPAGQTQRLF